jgi:hypothetical protein
MFLGAIANVGTAGKLSVTFTPLHSGPALVAVSVKITSDSTLGVA